MLCTGRAGTSGKVGTRSGYRSFGKPYKLSCKLIPGHTHSHRIKPCCCLQRYAFFFFKNQSHGTGPKPVHQHPCIIGNFTDDFIKFAKISYMNYQRIVRRSFFCSIDFFCGILIKRICPKTVHRFGRKRNKSASSYDFGGLL